MGLIGYFFRAESRDTDSKELANLVYAPAFRENLEMPGFALINLGQEIGSHDLRQLMVNLKTHLGNLYHARTGKFWHYLSMGRFNQQVTTKFHLDGAPEESILMLGYEPSSIESHLYLADYTRCAYTLGIIPRIFLDDLNPMFTEGAKVLAGFVTKLEEWRPADSQILIINNSSAPYEPSGKKLLGVLHKAEIFKPDLSKNRIVNSTMMFAVSDGSIEPISAD